MSTNQTILDAIRSKPTIPVKELSSLTGLSQPRVYQLLKQLKIEMRWTEVGLDSIPPGLHSIPSPAIESKPESKPAIKAKPLAIKAKPLSPPTAIESKPDAIKTKPDAIKTKPTSYLRKWCHCEQPVPVRIKGDTVCQLCELGIPAPDREDVG